MLSAVTRIGEAVDLDSFARITTATLLALVPGLSVSYNELNLRADRVFAVITPDPGPAWFAEYQPIFTRHMRDNPLIPYLEKTSDTRPLTWDDVPGSIVGTALERLFYAPNEIRSQLAMQLPAPPDVLIGVAVNRGEEGFSDRDRRILGLLRPHLVHAYRTVQVHVERSAMRSVLDANGWAVVLVDVDGRVLRSSPDTVEAAARFGLDVSHGVGLGDGPLRDLIETLASYRPWRPASPGRPILVQGDAGVLDAVVVPSPIGPHVLLLRPHEPTTSTLKAAGLTRRQVEVALALAGGGTNAEIARTLGIAPGTLKKHLEHIFDRLGVTNRAAAIARVHELIRGPADLRPGGRDARVELDDAGSSAKPA